MKKIFHEINKIGVALDIPIEVKLHPRSGNDKYGPAEVLKTKLPWEVYLLFNDITNMILVSVFSTTVYSPYLLFNMDVPVISLVNLIANSSTAELDDSSERIILNTIHLNTRIKQEDGLTIMTPENKKELVRLIDDERLNKTI